MCPIVPTFTCGFERSNFSLAIKLPKSLSSLVLPVTHRGAGTPAPAPKLFSNTRATSSTSASPPAALSPPAANTARASAPGLKPAAPCTARSHPCPATRAPESLRNPEPAVSPCAPDSEKLQHRARQTPHQSKRAALRIPAHPLPQLPL